MLDRCYNKYFKPPSLSCCSLAYGTMQYNKLLQINAIFKKNCFITFLHTLFSHLGRDRTFVLDRANVQTV